MVDLLGRLDTAALYQPFLGKLNALTNACAARGRIYVATSGLRTYEQQEGLYARGRDASGKVVDRKKIVTKARGGYSPHNFAFAGDFAPHAGDSYDGKLVPDYDAPGAYDILGEEARKLGLEWGGGWKSIKDTPHVQLPVSSRGLSWTMFRAAYARGGYPAVFSLLDSKGPW